MKKEIAVLGGGSWGTVLANLAAINGNKVTLWMRDETNVESINRNSLNKTYFDLVTGWEVIEHLENPGEFLENVTFLKKIEYRNLNLLIRNKYYKNRILLFGDALHQVHPFVGQGFNMILRDLAFLEKIFYRKLSLGLDIGSVDILDEFSSNIKPINFAFSIGVDLLKNSISFKKLRNETLKILDKSNFEKNILFNIDIQYI